MSPSIGKMGQPLAPTALHEKNDVLGVDHVGLTVPNLEKSKDFFEKVLGFKVVGGDEEYPSIFLSNGHTRITLWQVNNQKAIVEFDRTKNIGLHHLAFGVSSFEVLDGLYEQVRIYPGIIVEFSPELNSDGPAKHMMFYEPGGNRIELIHRPSEPQSSRQNQ